MEAGGANNLVLIGGGGHALVVGEAAFDSGWTVAGFYDDRADAPLSGLAPRLGGIAELLARVGADGTGGTLLLMAIGELAARQRVITQIQSGGDVAWARVRHPAATVSRRAEVGAGAYLGARCVVNIRARIGAHAIINTGAIVEHECDIGENAHIAPGAVLCGNVFIGAGTLIGAGARVIPGVRVGAGCVVGAGAVVVRDVADGAKVMGVPAR